MSTLIRSLMLLPLLFSGSVFGQETASQKTFQYKTHLQKVNSSDSTAPLYEAKLDVGLLRVNESRSAKLTFANPLAKVAKITRVQSTCTCTDVKAAVEPASPGGDFQLTFVFKSNEKPGTYATTIEVDAELIDSASPFKFAIRITGAVRDYLQFQPESSITLDFERGRADQTLKPIFAYNFFEKPSMAPALNDPKDILCVKSVEPIDGSLPKHALAGWKISLCLSEKAGREYSAALSSSSMPLKMQDTVIRFSQEAPKGSLRSSLVHVWLAPKEYIRTRTNEIRIASDGGTQSTFFDLFFLEPPLPDDVEFKLEKSDMPLNVKVVQSSPVWWRVKVDCSDPTQFLKGEALVITASDRGSVRIPIAAYSN